MLQPPGHGNSTFAGSSGKRFFFFFFFFFIYIASGYAFGWSNVHSNSNLFSHAPSSIRLCVVAKAFA